MEDTVPFCFLVIDDLNYRYLGACCVVVGRLSHVSLEWVTPLVLMTTQAFQEQALEVAQRTTAGRVPKPYVGRTLDTLHPPRAPSLFQRDWLRSLLCEG